MIKGIYWKCGVWAFHPVFVREDESGVKLVLWYSASKTWSITCSEELEYSSGWQSSVLATGVTPGYEYDLGSAEWLFLWNSESDGVRRISASRYISELKSELRLAYESGGKQYAEEVTDALICFGVLFSVDLLSIGKPTNQETKYITASGLKAKLRTRTMSSGRSNSGCRSSTMTDELARANMYHMSLRSLLQIESTSESFDRWTKRKRAGECLQTRKAGTPSCAKAGSTKQLP